MRYPKPVLVFSALSFVVFGSLNLGLAAPSASQLAQIVPTDTPTVIPTNTLMPTVANTPTSPATQVASTVTPAATTTSPTKPSPAKGGGGAPRGPSGTPSVNGCVVAIGRDGVNLSTEPGFYKSHVQVVAKGQILFVVDGPQRVDTVWWWRLRTSAGTEGWGRQDDITPSSEQCATNLLFGTLQPTPGLANQLPRTGGGFEWWFFGGMLAMIVILVGVLRRRLQVSAAKASTHIPTEEDDL